MAYFACAYIRYRKTVDKEAGEKWNSVTAGLDTPTKEMLRTYREKAGAAFLKYIWFLSPELLPIVILGVLLVVLLVVVGIPILRFRRFLIDSNEKAIDLQLCNL